MKWLALAAAAISSVGVNAATWKDVQDLKTLVTGYGATEITYKYCGRNAHGYFHMDGGDLRVVICTDETPPNDVDLVWETLSHEAAHLMQWCWGGNLIKDSMIPVIKEELAERKPVYLELIKRYPEEHQRAELEAFWMETNTPSYVIYSMQRYCYPRRPFPIVR